MKSLLKTTWRFLRIFWGEQPWMMLGTALTFLAVAVSSTLGSVAVGAMVNQLVERGEWVWVAVGAFLAVQVVPSWCAQFQQYFMKLVWLFMHQRFELAIMKKKGDMDIASIEDPGNNDLFNRVNENLHRVQSFSERVFWIASCLVELGLAGGVVLYYGWEAFALMAVLTAPLLYVEVRYSKHVWGIHEWHAEKRRKFWNLQSHFHRAPNLIELKVADNVGHFHRLVAALLGEFRGDQKRAEQRKMVWTLSATTLSKIGFCLAAVYFVLQVQDGLLQVGTLLVLLSAINGLRHSLSGFFGAVGRQYEDGMFVADLFRFLDMPPVLSRPAGGLLVLTPGQTPTIEFRNVSFRYPNTEKYILKDFNLTIQPGERVALVGLNGAGKTTLIKLLCRFYDPSSGIILVNGFDLRRVVTESWRRQLGVLFQDYSTYSVKVSEGIALGDTEAAVDLNRVQEAAFRSEAADFIEKYPDRYEQQIGKEFAGGIDPSVGQRQKLALARTYYRSPNVLVLDEPTASVDADAEAKIFERLGAWPAGKTAVFVSHRFSTVRQAERIVVIGDGRVVEDGSHDALVANDGEYARLFRLQAQGYA